MRKTKIVCTMGPSTDNDEVLKNILLSGMNAARFNFSHGSHEEHQKRIDNLKRIVDDLGKTIALILDTKGPEIRIKQFESGTVFLKEGESFSLYCKDCKGDEHGVSITYEGLDEKLSVGDTVLIDDGLIELCVTEILKDEIVTKVISGGELKNNKSINIPGVAVPLPALTDKDKSDLLFGIKNEIDFVAASFVRSGDDVAQIREFLDSNGGNRTKIIAKIENRQGVDNIDDILLKADGVMVARGDLGVEIPPEEVPMVQKKFVKKCNEAGKPVIIATQMLDSMIRNPRPTRAETADVANAVLDGADAVMLSGETAAGKYPVEAVKMMARIAESAEEEYSRNVSEFYGDESITNIIAHATCTSANRLGAKAIITPTTSGYTPRMVSKYRPNSSIIAVSVNKYVVRQLSLTRGVIPLEHKHMPDFESTVKESIAVASKNGYVKNDDLVIITSGLPAGEQKHTNTVRVEIVNMN